MKTAWETQKERRAHAPSQTLLSHRLKGSGTANDIAGQENCYLGQTSEEGREGRNTCWEGGDEAKRSPVRPFQSVGEEARRTKARNRNFGGLELDRR